MQRNHSVATAMLATAAGLAVAAYYLGPPVSHPYSPQASARPAALSGFALISEAISIQSFGMVPRCADEMAIRTVVGMLRQHTFMRILGLANIAEVAGRSSGERECQAVVELGQRDVVSPVGYAITKLAGRGGWQITVHADAAPTLPARPPP